MNSRELPAQEPSDDDLLSWAGDEQFFLFCDRDEFLQIARAVLARYGAAQPIYPEIPEGWPTDKMVVRGAEEVFDCLRQHGIEIDGLNGTDVEQYIAESVFGAMIGAAPPDVKESLTAAPVAYAVFAENGNIRIWSADPIQVETLRQEYGDQVQALYAVPQPAEQSFKSDIAETEKERRLERDIASTIEKMMGLNAQNRALVETLKSIEEWVLRYADPNHPVATVARKALAAHRKVGAS